MSFFDFFKKRPSKSDKRKEAESLTGQPTTPNKRKDEETWPDNSAISESAESPLKPPISSGKPNELEILLQRAATDPSARIEFYKKLLSEPLVVISGESGDSAGMRMLEKDTQVKIVSFPDGKIPIFTSIDRIFDKGVVKEQVNYLSAKGEHIFDLAKGATFLLNPYSDYGKELVPDEIKSLLDGTIFHSLSGPRTVEKNTRVLIGQPTVYPTEMVNSLIELFANEPAVKAAYIGYMKFPDSDEPPHYVFCIDADGDTRALNQKAGPKAQQFLKSGEFVDFVDKDSLGGYFNKIAPFYKK